MKITLDLSLKQIEMIVDALNDARGECEENYTDAPKMIREAWIRKEKELAKIIHKFTGEVEE